MFRRGVISGLLPAAVALCLVVSAGWADLHGQTARVIYVEGGVQVDRADGRGFQPALVNLPIAQSFRLLTHDDGVVKVEFEDGSTLRIVPDTILSFDRLGLRDSGARLTSINLHQGTIYCDLHKQDNDEFLVTVGQQELELRQPSRFRVNVFPTGIKVAVFDGEVEFHAPNKSVTLKKNDILDTDETDGLYTSQTFRRQPSTLAPLRPTGPSSPIVPHWPPPVSTHPRF